MNLDPSADRARLEREVRIQQRLRDMLLGFSQGVSDSQDLVPALEPLPAQIRDILEAESVEIWLHRRRNRQLVLAASAGGRPVGDQAAVDDSSHDAAAGLRLERPENRGTRIVAPLRGWRRALGALIINQRDRGTPTAIDDASRLAFTHELARQLSVGIENVLLLQDMLRQRRLLEDTFNSLIDLVAVVDADLRVVQTNEAFATRVGVPRLDVIGRSLRDFVGDETFAYVQTPDPQDAATPAQRRVDDPALRGTFLLTATPLSSQDGRTTGRVLVARDITRQTRLEAERAALHARLTQSEKLASLGQFVAGIAHEMNNPLQGIMGHLELLIDMTEAARPVRRDLKVIYHESERAAKIVHNLLVFTGSHRMARERTPIDRVVTRALTSRAAHLRKAQVEVARRKGTKLPDVFARSAAASAGRAERPDQRGARDGGRRHEAPRNRDLRARAGRRSASRSAIPDPAFLPMCCRGSSIPSSPPRKSAREAGSASPSATASSTSTAARSPQPPRQAAARSSTSNSRRRIW